MTFSGYRQVWAIPAVRSALLVGVLGRAPWFGAGIVLTLHIVGKLDPRYSAAGLITGIFTVCAAIASPWRGRMLDRIGLRRTLMPSLVALPVLFAIGPWVGYWSLLALMIAAGLLAIPWFALIRQVIIHATPSEHRRTALALDSIMVELSFMIGPALGVVSAVYLDTSWALLLFSLASVAAGWVMWWLNPAISPEESAEAGRERPRWVNAPVVTALLVMLAATFILGGSDLGLIAGLRAMGVPLAIAPVMITWSLGSALGGLAYGALHRPVPSTWLLLGLAATTLPVALAPSPVVMSGLLFVAGLFCAPTLAATVDEISRNVPATRLGEAMGWHGSVSTLGSAASPPIIGWVIDSHGWGQGFVWASLGGFLVAVTGLVMIGVTRGGRSVARRRRHSSIS